MSIVPSFSRAAALSAVTALALLLGACANNELEVVGESVGQRITRTACPAVAVPAYTGDVTLFDPPASRTAAAIDVVATMTNVRGACDEASGGDQLSSTVSFQVDARRMAPGPARDVTLPYFATVLHGGTVVDSKQIAQLVVHFEAGAVRGQATGQATARINRAAATISPEVMGKINRKRKPTDADASVDPMSDPAVKAAMARATFELLVGFQLSNDQLAYNATR